MLDHLISLTVHRQLGSQQKCDDQLGFGNRRRSREITIAGLSSSVIKVDSDPATGVPKANHPQLNSAVRPPPEAHSSGPSPCGVPCLPPSQWTYGPSLPPASAQVELPTASCYVKRASPGSKGPPYTACRCSSACASAVPVPFVLSFLAINHLNDSPLINAVGYSARTWVILPCSGSPEMLIGRELFTDQ